MITPPVSDGAAFEIGFADPLFTSADSSIRSLWLDRAVQSRADMVRISVFWSQIAGPARPTAPASPADPSYDFSQLDAAVRDASARGLDILLNVASAPDWAEGPGRPPIGTAAAGTWKPDAAGFGDFAHALAARYSGGFMGLPRVRFFQAWNEPNLDGYLTPQWAGNVSESPVIYRGLLNAFYAGVKSVNISDQVVTAGTAPYGDPPGGKRVPPALFWRTLLCLNGQRLRPVPCPDPSHFDIAAHHPINDGAPTRGALNQDDISTPDLGRLKRILNKARQTHRSKPAGRKPLWATEIWWNSNPPDPSGLPLPTQARWLEQSFYELWRQGASAVVWLLIGDEPGPAAPGTQSGLFTVDGTPKPAYQAFRFPFVGDRLNRSRVRVWGMALGAGRVRVQRKFGPGWKTIARLRAGRDRVFVGKLRLGHRARLRARADGETSLVWRQR